MDATTIVGICLFTMIFVVGVPGNSLILWVFARKPRKSSTSLLILSLAFVDLGGCLIAPVHLFRAFGGVFINDFVCKFSIYGSRAFSFSSLNLTPCIAIDRYMAICKPLGHRHKRKTFIVTVFLSIALALSGHLQFAIYVTAIDFGSVKRCMYRGGPNWLDLSNEILTSLSYLLTLVICTCAYVRIYLGIRKLMKVRAGMEGNGLQAMHRNIPALPSGNAVGGYISDHSLAVTMPTTHLHAAGSVAAVGNRVNNSDSLHDRVNAHNPAGPSNSNHGMDSREAGMPSKNAETTVTHVAWEMQSVDPTSHQGPGVDNGAVPAPERARRSNQSRQRKERLMTRMLLGANLILIMSWLPSFILTNIPDEQVAAYRVKASQGILISFSYQLRTLNHIVSIFVYALLNEDFRNDCKDICHKLLTLIR